MVWKGDAGNASYHPTGRRETPSGEIVLAAKI
jgi:hypothetical protein